MARPEIEPRSPGPLANTLPTRPMSRFCKFHLHFGYNQIHFENRKDQKSLNLNVYEKKAKMLFRRNMKYILQHIYYWAINHKNG